MATRKRPEVSPTLDPNTDVSVSVEGASVPTKTRKARNSIPFSARLENLAKNIAKLAKRKRAKGIEGQEFSSALSDAANALSKAASLAPILSFVSVSAEVRKEALASLAVGQAVTFGGHAATILSIEKKGRGDSVKVRLDASGVELVLSKSQVQLA